MEKEIRDESSPSDAKTSMTTATATTSSSLTSDFDFDFDFDFDVDFSSMYNSVFPPRSSLSPSLITDDRHRMATEHRLQQARLILEYQQLCDHYDLCFSRLQAITRELETLRQQNADLRLANARLLKIITGSFHRMTEDIPPAFAPNNVMEPNRLEKRTVLERESFPKSISVRSSGCTIKPKQANASSGTSRPRAQRVYVPPGNNKREEAEEAKAVELEVYNQGMWKTELCNKWQETGSCPYGDYCQFAHDFTELRPVIRHPKYKTEVCRMVLSGGTCPYGHRCHFRHSLTEQERIPVPR
ncbi:hypothetical protein WN944_005219 [Citrus x changshan-huyou]|uniref:Zinc finger CCCH domain-containing protein 14 n=2 Tax=Citrus TaxID=2706 RepID=A0ACB8K5J1_CITSI|nr:zinc finger CCCH domain-containing protein 14 [Citrus sinensis]